MKTKSIVIGAGLVLAGAAFLAYNKYKEMQAVFDKMTIKPSDISALAIDFPNISFKLDFKITNPTNAAFSISGGSLVKLKRIIVSRNGKYLGTAELNMEAIDIPPMSEIEIKHIPFTVSLQNAMFNILTSESLSVGQLTIEAVIDVLGTEYLITE